jgi:DNA-binding GntR family transcriptional regulator
MASAAKSASKKSATKRASMPARAGRAARPELGLAHGICEQLQQLIYSGEVGPGERLNEAALAVRMGTSRGPIREAIRMLTGIGLVVAVPNRGVFVRQISVREMLEIYELRALLFGFAAQQAAEHLSETDRQEFEQLLAGMDAACEAGDGQRYYVLNLRFHALLMAQCQNRRAQRAYEDHVKELHLYRRRYFNATINMRRSNNEHRRIFEAIASGAQDRANKLAQAHVLHGRQRLLATLDTPAEPATGSNRNAPARSAVKSLIKSPPITAPERRLA